MSDTNNVADTFGGGANRRRDDRLPAHLLPKPVTVPTYDNPDPGVIADSDRVVEQLRSTMDRHVASTNRPSEQPATNRDQPKATMTTATTPLREIAQRIKKLVHDDGEQMGDELKSKIGTDGVSIAKALQLWADDTLREKEKSPAAN
jgi:hypothetical protein